ncbi:MAG TPA: cytochrome c oxidase assembly protein [Steroidobacteraceae bacterium]|nr:cytochrome c oxidase assembly protein [Steroidobacteraceae bacterium]
MTPTGNNKRRQVRMLLVLAAGMFGFAFALVPLYETFCELTGLNGRTSVRARAFEPAGAPTERKVKIQFLAQVANGMPWEFRPVDKELRVRLGTVTTVQFYARNRAATPVIGQAVPSVAPGIAAPYLNKLECFCFSQQRLEAGAAVEMPVRFYLGTDLPDRVHTLTLSYTMFPVTEAHASNVGASPRRSSS